MDGRIKRKGWLTAQHLPALLSAQLETTYGPKCQHDKVMTSQGCCCAAATRPEITSNNRFCFLKCEWCITFIFSRTQQRLIITKALCCLFEGRADSPLLTVSSRLSRSHPSTCCSFRIEWSECASEATGREIFLHKSQANDGISKCHAERNS